MARQKQRRLTPDDWQIAYDAVVDAIEDEASRLGLSNYRLWQESGVAQSVLSRMKLRQGTLTTENLFRLLILLDGKPTSLLARCLRR